MCVPFLDDFKYLQRHLISMFFFITKYYNGRWLGLRSLQLIKQHKHITQHINAGPILVRLFIFLAVVCSHTTRNSGPSSTNHVAWK